MATQGALHTPPVLESLANFTADLGTLRTTDAVQERQAKVQEAARRLMQDESVRTQACEIGARGKESVRVAGRGQLKGRPRVTSCRCAPWPGHAAGLLSELCILWQGGHDGGYLI